MSWQRAGAHHQVCDACTDSATPLLPVPAFFLQSVCSTLQILQTEITAASVSFGGDDCMLDRGKRGEKGERALWLVVRSERSDRDLDSVIRSPSDVIRRSLSVHSDWCLDHCGSQCTE